MCSAMNIGQLITTLIPLAVLVFWAWMFADMRSSDDLPGCFISLRRGRDPRSDWTAMFVILSLVTAMMYYTEVYRSRL